MTLNTLSEEDFDQRAVLRALGFACGFAGVGLIQLRFPRLYLANPVVYATHTFRELSLGVSEA